MAMTKADLVDQIYEKIGFSKKEAADMVELIFDTLKDNLGKGMKIKVSGFGNFIVREKRSRVGRNPQTGKSIEISARRVLTFKPSQVLRAGVNGSLETKPITKDDIRQRSKSKIE
jgi:integration host factor subunit alpha